MKFVQWIGAAALVGLLAACLNDPVAPAAPPALPPGVQLITTPSGLQYADLTVGTGAQATTGSTVTVHYTGWLQETGTMFDTSLDRTPLTFTIPTATLIAGWNEGVRGMRVGGIRRLVIPPSLGYGDREDVPAVPPGSTLIFDLHLRGSR